MRRVAPPAPPLSLLIAAPPGAKIVVQKSIAGVKLGMTAQEVRGVLGTPDAVSYPKNEIQGSVKVYRYGKTKITFPRGANGKAQSVSTTSRKQKTAGGVGVGSTEAAVKADVSGVKCESFGGLRSCHVGALKPGRKVTDFILSAGKVTRVTLGIVID